MENEDSHSQRERLIRVTTRHFVAGMIVKDDVVIRAAPILAKYIGHSFRKLLNEWPRRGWWCSEIKLPEESPASHS